MIRYIGYACINESLRPLQFKSCRLNTIHVKGIDHLKGIISHNLDLTLDILNWNVDHGIYFYRMSSDLMPLVTHPEILKSYDWRWYDDKNIQIQLSKIETFVAEHKIRLTMHPDQFTVLNSPNPVVVGKSVEYLDYHARILEMTGGTDMIIHVGGVYGDKKSAVNRFISNYILLTPKIKGYIRLENDDRSYTVKDIIEIHNKTGIKLVFDFHHHRCNQSSELTSEELAIIMASWTGEVPKIHVSTGKARVDDRSHHDYIHESDIKAVSQLFEVYTIDVMVEAKQKDLAAIKYLEAIRKD